MALMFVGKLLIAIGLCFQAYLLFSNPPVAQNFNTVANKILGSCDCLPPNVVSILKQHLRMAVVVLLGFSGLMVVTRNTFIKFLVLLGYLIFSYVRHYPITQIPPLTDHSFYENLAIIGGIIYLMGADCSSPRVLKTEAPKTKSKQK